MASAALAALSKSDPTRITIAVLGVIVGVVTQLLHIWRPAERSAAYYRARQALLREGWDYVQRAGAYAMLQGDQARYQRFRAQVSAIEEAAAAYDEQAESATGPAPANGTPSQLTAPDQDGQEEAKP